MDISYPLHRKKAESLGLSLTTGPGGIWPREYDLSSSSREERLLGLKWHQKNVDITSELGGFAYNGCLYAHSGVLKKWVPTNEEYKLVADGLHQLARYAQTKGVQIALEPMSHFRTSLVNTPGQLMQLVNMTDHQNVKVILDSYHMVTEVRDFREAILTVKDALIGFHACENDRGCPGGGIIPWDAIFSSLKEISYDGYMMLETYNSSIDNFAVSRGMLHNVCPDPVDYVNRGFDFIRKGIA